MVERLKNQSTRPARWLIIARQFNSKIKFISGVQNSAAESLSRFFTHGIEGEEVEESGVVLNKIQFRAISQISESLKTFTGG